jgi:hypothetical protein
MESCTQLPQTGPLSEAMSQHSCVATAHGAAAARRTRAGLGAAAGVAGGGHVGGRRARDGRVAAAGRAAPAGRGAPAAARAPAGRARRRPAAATNLGSCCRPAMREQMNICDVHLVTACLVHAAAQCLTVAGLPAGMLQARACHRARVGDDPGKAQLESCQEARSRASCTPPAALLGWPLPDLAALLAHAHRPPPVHHANIGDPGPRGQRTASGGACARASPSASERASRTSRAGCTAPGCSAAGSSAPASARATSAAGPKGSDPAAHPAVRPCAARGKQAAALCQHVVSRQSHGADGTLFAINKASSCSAVDDPPWRRA